MAQPQESAGHLTGLSFTVANILDLPEDQNKSTAPVRRHALDIASPPSPQLINAGKNCSYCLPYSPWTVGFSTHFHPSGTGVHKKGRDKNGLGFDGRRPTRKKKRRLLFSPHQVQKMENEFDSTKYLTEGKRADLAVELKVTETQVKTWFQNRRTKWRKELRNENPPREVPDGRLKYAIEARKCGCNIHNH